MRHSSQDGDQSVPQVDARSNDASLGRSILDIGDFNGPSSSVGPLTPGFSHVESTYILWWSGTWFISPFSWE